MNEVVPVLVSAMTLGALYALLASGLALIWSTLKVFNYAHGALLVLGGYAIWTLVGRAGLPVPVAYLVALPVLALAGVLLDRIAVRPFAGRAGGDLQVMVATLAMASVVEGAAQLGWGSQNRQIPAIVGGTFAIADVAVSASQAVAVALALVLICALVVVLRRTEWGWTLRAVEQNRDLARVLGIDPGRVSLQVFAIAGAFACTAGLVYGQVSTITPTKGGGPLLSAFVVLVFGGTASVVGALAGGFAIGLLEATTSTLLGLQWSPVAVVLLLVAVMVVRPEGLVRARGA